MHEGKNYRFLARYLECGREMDLKRWELLKNDNSLALEQMSDEPLVEPWKIRPGSDRGIEDIELLVDWVEERVCRTSVSGAGPILIHR